MNARVSSTLLERKAATAATATPTSTSCAASPTCRPRASTSRGSDGSSSSKPRWRASSGRCTAADCGRARVERRSSDGTETMTAPSDRSAGLDGANDARLDPRQADQDRTLAAIHRVEAALTGAAPGREAAWRNDVVAALAVLHAPTDEEEKKTAPPDRPVVAVAR